MSLAIANLPLKDACNDRSIPAALALGRWHLSVHFYSLRGGRNWHHAVATDPAKAIGSLITSRLADLYQKVQTQIPIARSSLLTTLPHPAVSSLGAYQTPAR
jgi:hypothetical protein